MMLRSVLMAAIIAVAHPAFAAGTNQYGGYDIAAMDSSMETGYGAARDWSVKAGFVGGSFGYCAGETRDGDTVWRLGFDGLQWQLAVPYAPAGDTNDWQGTYEVDGVASFASGVAANGWTFMWMGLEDLDRVRKGNGIVLEIGRASIAHPLNGTAAVITKIEECLSRKGNAGEVQAAAVSGTGCANRLAGTGLCPGEAAALIGGTPPSQEAFFEPYQHCRWALNDAPLADSYVLYYAAECNGRKSKLDFAGGAHFAELSLIDSAYAEGAFTPGDMPLVRVTSAYPEDDKQAAVQFRARDAIEDPARAAQCVAMPGTEFGYPPDSYIVNVSPEHAASLSEDELMTGACGPFGMGDSAKFWRVFSGFAWFFDLGQDAYQDIDAGSLTLVVSDGKGGWMRAE